MGAGGRMAGRHASSCKLRRLLFSSPSQPSAQPPPPSLLHTRPHLPDGYGPAFCNPRLEDLNGPTVLPCQSVPQQHGGYGGGGRPQGVAQNLQLGCWLIASRRGRVSQHVHGGGSHWAFFPKRALSYEGDGFQNGEEDLQTGPPECSASSVNVEGGGSSVSEVAAATVDCSYPTALLQVLIENVHLQAGLPWWAAISVTTLAVRAITLPVVVYQMKSMAKLTLLRPELESISNEMKESGYEPQLVKEGRQRIKELFQRYEVKPFSPFLGAVVQAPVFICFFFGIRNMADKVDSFKEGGMLWFSDLSTPDDTYIFPILTAITFWVNVELNALEGMEGNPIARKMKNAFRFFTILLIPLTVAFEKALFCYWITSNLWSLCQASVLKRRAVKDALGIPDTSHLLKKSTDASKPFYNL